MKRVLSILLTVTMLFALCACGNTVTEPAPTPEVTEAPAQPQNEQSDLEKQIILLFNSVCMLKTNPEYGKYWYCVTDLDQNGRLEITGAVTEGSGSFTTAMMYEVGEDLATLQTVDLGLAEGEFLPEIIMNKVDTYCSPVGTWNYLFSDTTSVDSGNHFQAIVALTLENGKLISTPLCYLDVKTENGVTQNYFHDSFGNELSGLEEFRVFPELFFADCTKTVTYFDWFSLTEIYSTERLAKSYGVFEGTETPAVDPMVEPVPIYTQQPTVTAAPTAKPTPSPAPTAVPAPQVTKNPTAETVYVGGSCQFIAKADYSTGMRWKLMDPSGYIYDVASTPFAGQLVASGVTANCITLSNIPLGMDGYKIFAEFYGTTTVQSKSCGITVKQAPSATVSASATSGAVFGDLWNTIYLYSSDGSDIEYECFRGGDSGPYESGIVQSGSPISLVGVEGQSVPVEVYACAVGSSKNAYFIYTVDREPTPDPDPPMPEVLMTHGVLGVRETMSTVPVIVNGSTYYVTLDFVSPQGVNLDEGTECVVYYVVSLDNIISVVIPE